MENREIKFRAWDDLNKRMIYPDFVFGKGGRSNGDIVDGFERLMQFTGIKDNNGCDVYEGDIIGNVMDGYNENCTVVYIEGILCAQNSKRRRPLNVSNFSKCGWLNVKNGSGEYDFAVKGNVYENPEMIHVQTPKKPRMTLSDMILSTNPQD